MLSMIYVAWEIIWIIWWMELIWVQHWCPLWTPRQNRFRSDLHVPILLGSLGPQNSDVWWFLLCFATVNFKPIPIPHGVCSLAYVPGVSLSNLKNISETTGQQLKAQEASNMRNQPANLSLYFHILLLAISQSFAWIRCCCCYCCCCRRCCWLNGFAAIITEQMLNLPSFGGTMSAVYPYHANLSTEKATVTHLPS